VSRTFSDYISATCSRKKYSPEWGDFQMPFTGTAFRDKFLGGKAPFVKDCSFASFWMSNVNKIKSRSLFSALRGNPVKWVTVEEEDEENPGQVLQVRVQETLDPEAEGGATEFGSAADAVHNTRLGLARVDTNTIQTIGDGSALQNSYVLDFLLHGSLKTLSLDNGINQTEGFLLVRIFWELGLFLRRDSLLFLNTTEYWILPRLLWHYSCAISRLIVYTIHCATLNPLSTTEGCVR